MTVGRLDAEIDRAAGRVYRHAIETPVLHSSRAEVADSIFLKLECLQVTGSFKVRGAANKLEALRERGENEGVVACSSGNHGRAVANVARHSGMRAVIFVPGWVDPSKLDGMRADGADVRLEGDTYDAAEAAAMEYAETEGLPFVSPFDDPEVIAGQGTIGLELLAQVDRIETIIVPLSGGGLAVGIAAAIKRRAPHVRIVAASAERARVMYESVRAGRVIDVDEQPTLAGALSGGIGKPNRYTFTAVRDLVDDHVLVPERLIEESVRRLWGAHRLVVEGGGAVGFGALLAWGASGNDLERAVVVISGANIDLDVWRKTLGVRDREADPAS